MRYCVVVVKDLAADVFAQPQFCAHPNQALRGFRDQVNESPVSDGNVVAKHPQDFVLYELGSFDDGTCRFELLEVPRQIAHASDLVQS